MIAHLAALVGLVADPHAGLLAPSGTDSLLLHERRRG